MKQTIEIEVPEGKKAIWNNGKITFAPNDWRSITTFKEACDYVERNLLEECRDIITSYNCCKSGSYEEKVAKYRIVVAALTHNEKRHLTTGKSWVPVVQFCLPKDSNNCWGNVVVGTIESKGERYLVVSGPATIGSYAGLSDFLSAVGVSSSSIHIGFRSVSSKEVAEHISKYFGKLLFEVHYGGTNCDWKWVD